MEDDEVNADMLYQAQFLQVFGLTQYDDDAINAGMQVIKAKSAGVPDLKALILQHPYVNKSGLNVDDHAESDAVDVILTLLFAYPTMDVFHLCLIDAFTTGRISQEHQEQLRHVYSTLY